MHKVFRRHDALRFPALGALGALILALALSFGPVAAFASDNGEQSDSPQSDPQIDEPVELGVSNVLGAESVPLWTTPKFTKIGANDNSTVSLSADGQLYVWGELATAAGNVAVPLPTAVSLPEGTKIQDVGTHEAVPLLILENGSLVFVQVQQDEGSGALTGSLKDQQTGGADQQLMSGDCEAPFLSFQDAGVRNSQGMVCYLVVDEFAARTSSDAPYIDGEVMAKSVRFGRGWVTMSESGNVYELSFPGWTQQQLMTGPGNDFTGAVFTAIVPDGEDQGALGLASDGLLHPVYPGQGGWESMSGYSGLWSNTAQSDYCYARISGEGLFRAKCQNASNSDQTRYAAIDMGSLGAEYQQIQDLVIAANHVVALLEDGRVFTWGSNDYGQLGWLSGAETSSEVPNEIGIGPDVPVKVGDDEVITQISGTDTDVGTVSIPLPPHVPDTVQVTAPWGDKEVILGEHTYYLDVTAKPGKSSVVSGSDKESPTLEAEVTLVVPEDQRPYASGQILKVVSRTGEVASTTTSGSAADSDSSTDENTDSSGAESTSFAPAAEVTFDDQGSAVVLVRAQEGAEVALAVVGPNTANDAVVVPSAESPLVLEKSPSLAVFVVAGALLVAVAALVGVVIYGLMSRKKRQAYAA